MNNYNLGFNVFNRPPEEFFEYAYNHQLNHIEINLTQEHSSLDSFNPNRIDKLNRLSEQYKVKLSIHLPYSVNISDIIGPIRNTNLSYIKKCIVLANRINATHITSHLGNFYWFPLEKWMRRKAMQRYLKCLNQVLEFCEVYEVNIALENVVPIPHGSEFYLLGDTVKDFQYIYSNAESNYLKFCLDTGHANMSEGVTEYIKNFHNKLICIHFHDNSGKNDEHLPVGQGNIPWQDVVNYLGEINYRGPLISECRNIKPHIAAELVLKYFNNTSNTADQNNDLRKYRL